MRIRILTTYLLPNLIPAMPIHCPVITKRITRDEFKLIANQGMHHIFSIYNGLKVNDRG